MQKDLEDEGQYCPSWLGRSCKQWYMYSRCTHGPDRMNLSRLFIIANSKLHITESKCNLFHSRKTYYHTQLGQSIHKPYLHRQVGHHSRHHDRRVAHTQDYQDPVAEILHCSWTQQWPPHQHPIPTCVHLLVPRGPHTRSLWSREFQCWAIVNHTAYHK